MSRKHWFAGLVIPLVAVVVDTYGGIVAGWDVEGVDVDNGVGLATNTAPYVFYATTSDTSQVTASMGLGEGVFPSTSANQYGFKISANDQTNSLSGAIASDHYLEFSITVETGFELNLSTIEMNGEGSSTACSNVVLMSSIDGFVAGEEIATSSTANTTGGFDTDESGFGAPIDLTAVKYQNLTGTVSFRIYGWNSSSGAGTTRIRNLAGNDLVVYGDVIPLHGNGMPNLTLGNTNGMVSVGVVFSESPATNYVLQQVGDLAESNGWHNVSTPFSTGTNWLFETTNDASFYRVVPQ